MNFRSITRIALLVGCYLVGCTALPQTKILGVHPGFAAYINKGDEQRLRITWKSASLDPNEQPDIDSSKCYAVSDSGKRFDLLFKEDPFTGVKSFWKGGNLMLVDKHISKSEVPTYWSNGRWHVHVEFTSKVPRHPIDIDIEIWTLYYNPVIHGAPN